jgi:hypothetical protein
MALREASGEGSDRGSVAALKSTLLAALTIFISISICLTAPATSSVACSSGGRGNLTILLGGPWHYILLRRY